jgi:hypothetical protein
MLGRLAKPVNGPATERGGSGRRLTASNDLQAFRHLQEALVELEVVGAPGMLLGKIWHGLYGFL